MQAMQFLGTVVAVLGLLAALHPTPAVERQSPLAIFTAIPEGFGAPHHLILFVFIIGGGRHNRLFSGPVFLNPAVDTAHPTPPQATTTPPPPLGGAPGGGAPPPGAAGGGAAFGGARRAARPAAPGPAEGRPVAGRGRW